MNIRDVIIEALAEGESYGLEIIGRIERKHGKVYLAQARVYPELRALEREGFLESWEGEPLPERGNRPRRYYRIPKLEPKPGDYLVRPDGNRIRVARVSRCGTQVGTPIPGEGAFFMFSVKSLQASGYRVETKPRRAD